MKKSVNKGILLIIALICSMFIIMCMKNYVSLDSGIIILFMAIFVMFEMIIISSYEIIKMRKLKLNICRVLQGMNGIVLMLFAFLFNGRERAIPVWIVTIFLINFIIISLIVIKIEQKVNK